MSHKFLLLMAPLAIGIGCSQELAPAAPAEDHPGHADAPAADLPRPSSTLDATEVHHPPAEDTPSADSETMDKQAEHADHSNHAAHDHADHSSASDANADAPVYVCPMHPAVTSTDSKARCPECGMNLELRAEQPPADTEGQM